MQTEHVTTTALLDGLLDPQARQPWIDFDARFRPIIRGFAMKLGLTDADAEDVTQECLARFVRHYREGKYDRTRGRLSSWLVAIARNCISDLWQSRAGRLEHHGESELLNLPDTDELGSLWDEECRRVLLDHGMRELRGSTRLELKTIGAFEMLVLGQREPADVATEMGMSLSSVYTAKNRCLTQLREILARLNAVYEVE